MFSKILKKIKKEPVELKGSMVPRVSQEGTVTAPAPTTAVAGQAHQQLRSSGGQAGAVVENKRQFEQGLVSTKDIIAPSSLQVDFDHIQIGGKYYRTLFVATYPRFVGLNWLSSLINFDASLNVSMFVYPTDGKEILDDLRRKIAEMEAEISTDIQRGRVVNPATQAKLEDALTLQKDLVKGEERFFQFGLYVTISADSVDELNQTNKNLEAALGALMIISKRTTLQMEEGFVTTLPVCSDQINVTRNMDTTSLATTFPFVSSDLSDDKGIMYGINEHNGSLVIFDRFSMPNYNSVLFATSGVGKSYLVKLEVMRSLMMGTDIVVIDPENEYKVLCDSVGGQYIAFGYGEKSKINPFDLSLAEEEGENALNTKVLSLHKLLKVMLGEMAPLEESLLDKAVMAAYKAKGINPDPETQKKEAPLLEDLYKALIGMEEKMAQGLAARLEKYIKGSFAGIFNQKTTVNLKNKFVVFGIRNLEDSLRPVAMHIVLDYIWTMIKKDLKKRILVVDEAWYLMQYDDSAAFLRGIIKRGRKYFLGVTTITQDVEDFLETPYGKEIVTNSAIQILLKQHSAAIDRVAEVFYLSEGEKQLLLTADKGEGIFFAGQNHVALRVIASEDEHKLITSDPGELVRQKQEISKKLDEVKSKREVKPGLNLQIKNEGFEGEESAKGKTTAGIKEVKKPTIIQERPAEVARQQLRSSSGQAGQAGQAGRASVVSIPVGQIRRDEGKQVAKTSATVAAPAELKPMEIDPQGISGPKGTSGPHGISGSQGTSDLQKRIKGMEEEEQKKLDEYKQGKAGPSPSSSGTGSGGASGTKKGILYKDLSKSGVFAPPKAEVVGTPGGSNQAVFVKQAEEEKRPQPPQLEKKVKAEFGKVVGKTSGTGDGQASGEKKLDYDELLGN